MSKIENWIDSFRTQNRENVYVLTVRIIKEEKEVKTIREVVDCLKGEVGMCYANNLLCRLSNEVLKDTEFEKLPWREYRKMPHESDKDYAYIKTKDRQNYAMAEMKRYQQLPEE